MGHTLAEKILMHNTGCNDCVPGDIVMTKPDFMVVLDIYSRFVHNKFREMGFEKAACPEKVIIAEDHQLPTCLPDDPLAYRSANNLAEALNVSWDHVFTDGIVHQLIPEKGIAKPGNMIICTDSHTVSYGAVGCFGTGVGYTEMASIIGSGEMWMKVPSAIKIQIDGTLPQGVYPKDIILRILGDLRADGGTYKALEFCGTTVDNMSVDERITLANMSVECGAKVGLFAPDAKTCAYSGVNPEDVAWLCFDEDAKYEQVLNYKASEFEPNLSCPQYVDNIHSVREMEGIQVNQIFLGSCTNGRLDDIRIAAEILKGKHVAKGVKFLVTPASFKIYQDALHLGYLQTLVKAGAMVTHAYCSICSGRSGGIICDGEIALSTNNRNFLGRMGSPKSMIYLGSPATIAVSAITGKITDPREFCTINAV